MGAKDTAKRQLGRGEAGAVRARVIGDLRSGIAILLDGRGPLATAIERVEDALERLRLLELRLNPPQLVVCRPPTVEEMEETMRLCPGYVERVAR